MMWIPRRTSVAEQQALLQKHTPLLRQYRRARLRSLKLLTRLNHPVYFGYHAFKLEEELDQLQQLRIFDDGRVDSAETNQVRQEEQEANFAQEQQRRKEAYRELKRFKSGKSLQDKKSTES